MATFGYEQLLPGGYTQLTPSRRATAIYLYCLFQFLWLLQNCQQCLAHAWHPACREDGKQGAGIIFPYRALRG